MKSLLLFMVMTWTPMVFSSTPGEILQEGSFIDAIEREDVALLRERIQIRLEGPFPEFVDEFFYLTETGGNIFHALAGVKTNQEEFSKTLKAFIDVFSIGVHARNIESVTLGETKIPFGKNLKNTLLFQTVQTGNAEKINREMENIFERGTALSALTYLHGRVEQAVLFPQYPKSKYYPPLIPDPDMSEMKLRHLKKMAELPPPYLKRDYNGFLPQQIASHSANNLPAFNVLSAAPDHTILKRANNRFLGGWLIGFAGGFLPSVMHFQDFVGGLLFAGNMALPVGMLAIGFPACLRVFKRSVIKRNLKKTNPSTEYNSAG